MEPSPVRFRAPAGLDNGHLQTILASTGLRIASQRLRRGPDPVLRRARRWLVPAGPDVRLEAWHTAAATEPGDRAVILLHGWEGSADSGYMRVVGRELLEHGWELIRLNLRDHGSTHHLNPALFHSNRLSEVVDAVSAIQAGLPGRRLWLVGFSLGGNFALRVGRSAAQAGLSLERVVAVNPPMDPFEVSRLLDGEQRLYGRYFRRKWLRSLERKEAAFPERYDFSAMANVPDLVGITEELVARHTEYPDVESYFRGYTLDAPRLEHLDTKATILTAEDDPIIPIEQFAGLDAIPTVVLDRQPGGGHCGYLRNWWLDSWLPTWIRAVLEQDLIDPGNRV